MKIYTTMPANDAKDAEENWIKGLLLFGSDYARAYLDARNQSLDDWCLLHDDEKIMQIEERMPPPSDGGWQNRPYFVVAPDIMAAKTDALGRIWRALMAYESRSRNTTLVRYCGVSSDIYGYEYVELIAGEKSSFIDLPICKEWADGEVSFEDIIEFLNK